MASFVRLYSGVNKKATADVAMLLLRGASHRAREAQNSFVQEPGCPESRHDRAVARASADELELLVRKRWKLSLALARF